MPTVDYGIHTVPGRSKFFVRVYGQGQEHYIGSCDTLPEAQAMRDKALSDLRDGTIKALYSREKKRSVDYDGDEITYYFDSIVPRSQDNPQMQLRFAVLLGAIQDLSDDEGDELHKGAVEWINGTVDSEPTFSFDEISEMLGVAPAALRKQLLTNKKLVKGIRNRPLHTESRLSVA